ncbi:N-acetylglutamate kinase [Haloactinospora alba]|uniref:N-acetylglutamate kinase n=1 Tax=Haloactinospora alba TaxID=405555 RepID=A0A543N956_9ACTN|nr:[LysW]-aminoadipate kinase [Haloactinospora alba]TQN28366.1 N-acetylglutamate kinase [Haloactinospora alba]
MVKVGGSVRTGAVLDDVAAFTEEGARVVLVHGGGGEVDRLAARLGMPARTLTSPDGTRGRRTDPETLDVVAMALLGRVKPALVEGLRARGVTAAGLCGADGAMVTAERKRALRSVEDGRVRVVRDDRSGRITGVRPEALRALLAADMVPVVSPPAASEDGAPLNVDSDHVAARIASALPAASLALLTDMPGVLRDPGDPSSLLRAIDGQRDEADGRMRHKVRAALDARRYVPRVAIASAHSAHPLRDALNGGGTVVTTSPGEDI